MLATGKKLPEGGGVSQHAQPQIGAKQELSRCLSSLHASVCHTLATYIRVDDKGKHMSSTKCAQQHL